jgi:arylsulfatase A-like enzyme
MIARRISPKDGSGVGPSTGKNIKNILLLVTDQHRADCLGCAGNTVLRTPHVDGLARNGIRFEHAFTPTPVCTPARTSLQTGLWAHRHRLLFNPEFFHTGEGREDPGPDVRFFGEALKARGWNTAHVGKWHIGTEATTPAARGYSGVFYPGYGFPGRPGQPEQTHPHYLAYLRRLGLEDFSTSQEVRSPDGSRTYAGLLNGPQEASVPAYLASQVMELIRSYSRRPEPFFISCDFWGPHAPYYLPQKFTRLYDPVTISPWPNFEADLSDKPGVIRRYGEYWKTGWISSADLSRLIGLYYGYISLIDEEIGRILALMKDTGVQENTLVIFTADHGSSVGAYRMWDKGFGMYDCITRIPFIVSHPALRPGVSDAFVSLLDLAPTFLELAGLPGSEGMDGRSLVPLLTGERGHVRENFIVAQHFGHQLPFWQRMVRTPDSKYVFNPTARDEYYDLAADPWETDNIIDRVEPLLLRRMRALLRGWMEKNEDPLWFWGKQML